jgi:hypothetical protein
LQPFLRSRNCSGSVSVAQRLRRPDACKPLYKAAAEKLQEQLGDLELVWSSSSSTSSGGGGGSDSTAGQVQSKQQLLLLALPFAALEALLADDRTRVTSENTVLYTIRSWYIHWQQRSLIRVINQQVQSLLHLIHMQHCSRLGVLAMSHSKVARSLFSWEELMLGCCLASGGLAVAGSRCPVLQNYPKWTAPKRPASSVVELSFVWPLKLSELEQSWNSAQTSSASQMKTIEVRSPVHAWQGLALVLVLRLRQDGTSSARTASSLCAGGPNAALPDSVVRSVAGEFSMLLPHVQQQKGRRRRQAGTATTGSGQALSLGLFDATVTRNSIVGVHLGEWGRFGSWPDLQRALEKQKLVHPDGCVRFQLRITKVD